MKNSTSKNKTGKQSIFDLPATVWLTALAIRRPVTTAMLMLSLFVTGLFASKLLPQESWPALNIPMAFINVPYNGATPEEVERLITRPIEEAVSTLGGITEIRSTSRADSASIRVMMDLGTDLDSKILEVREKVDMVRYLLPDDVQRVMVQKFSTEDLPVISLVLSGDKNLSSAYDFIDKKLKNPLERLQGVGKVEMRGVVQPNIEIHLDSIKLAMNRVDQAKLLQDLRDSNFLVKSGSILNGGRKFRVSPDGEYHSLADIKNFQVKAGVRLSEVATVSLTSPPKNSEIRTDRKKSVGLEVFKESDSNVVDVTNSIVALIEELRQDDDFKAITIGIKDNSGEEIQESLGDLLKAGALGIVLSFIVLFIFLRNSHITFVVVASVPISLSFALAGMYFMGYSLNMLSLAGLFIAVGLLIDNSVVICESILQQQDKALTSIEKILKGVDNVSIAIISGTLTTTIVFMPLLMGEKNFITILVEQIAVAICLPLLASLIISKTAIPLMLSRVDKKALSLVVTQGKLDRWYRPNLKRVLTHPKITGVCILLLCISGVLTKQMVNVNGEQGTAVKEINIVYHIQGQQQLVDVSKLVDEMEEYLYNNQQAFEFKQVNSRIWSNFAMSRIKLNDDYSKTLYDLKAEIKKGFPDTAIAQPSFDWSDQKQDLIKLTLNGSSTKRLIEMSESVISQLSNVEGFAEVGIDNEDKNRELVLRIDREKVSRLGLNTQDIASRISSALRGTNLRSFRDAKLGEIDIRLVYHEDQAVPLERIKELPIYESKGRVITLQQLVVFDTQPIMQQITRSNRRTTLGISINLADLSRVEASTKVKEVMDNIVFPSGYDWNLGRQFAQDEKAAKDMMINMFLALALIFIVMAALFESLLMPIAILSSIGLAFIGVYWTFAILGMGLGETGMIGMLILMGIVVNNGIVLIDQINKLKVETENIMTPIIEACVSRIRPIFMTVATTIIGMVPLAFASSDSQAYPMAVAIIGGLLFSTFTSLFLVPFCYLMLVKLGERSSKRFAMAKAFADKKIPL
ncbi:MAG: HAE1 family hydrophobic/amphiphilic exporter-1 [Colwellia sp.]|jgi:HAE1 family hydrophobic/amphiphilic exporter-1